MSASSDEPAVRRPRRHEVGVADRSARATSAATAATARGVEQRRRPAGAGPRAAAQHEDEAGVGQAGERPRRSRRAAGRRRTRRCSSAPEISTMPAQHERQRGEQPAPARSPSSAQATKGTTTTCRLPSTVASPAPTSSIAWCQQDQVRGEEDARPATASRRSRARPRGRAAGPRARRAARAAGARRSSGRSPPWTAPCRRASTRIDEKAIVSAPATAAAAGRSARARPRPLGLRRGAGGDLAQVQRLVERLLVDALLARDLAQRARRSRRRP